MAMAVGLIAVPAWSATSGVVDAHSAQDPARSVTITDIDSCPVLGEKDFIDSWGDPRSSGRRHEGVDMVAERGTPVVAATDGDAEFKRSNLGGNAIWLTSDRGARFYYAHLDAWAGDSRRVRAGEIIGYVGQTGNARGDHLHFESRAGDAAVNPYPLVAPVCLPTATPTGPGTLRSLLR